MTQEEISDEALFAAYRKGDMAAFDALYARLRQPLYLYLLRRGHAESVAEDLFHDLWMKVLNHSAGFDGEHLRAWLFTIARNLSTDAFRRAHIRVVDEQTDTANIAGAFSAQRIEENRDCVELIKRSIAALPLEQRDAFLLRHEAGLSLLQLGELMAVGRETIKSRLRYAMNQLKTLMADCL